MNVALARTKRHGGSVAVLLVDLDHFEVLNSAFGHGVADRVLTAMADRLADCIRIEDALGRFGSDEFIIALGDTMTDADVSVVARRALARGEFELHYQPEVNVQTGRIECIEALLRWRHPDVGIIPAADFFSAAEQGQLDAPITEWVMFEAARQAKQWHAEGMRNLRVAINVSSTQFYDRGFAGKVK